MKTSVGSLAEKAMYWNPGDLGLGVDFFEGVDRLLLRAGEFFPRRAFNAASTQGHDGREERGAARPGAAAADSYLIGRSDELYGSVRIDIRISETFYNGRCACYDAGQFSAARWAHSPSGATARATSAWFGSGP